MLDSPLNQNESSEASSPADQNLAPDGAGQDPGVEEGSMNLDMILDLPVTVSIELGRTVLKVEDILQFGQGSVVELDKLAGEPFEVLVQGRTIGKGEVVVVNEKFGIRITDVLSAEERIERLG